MLCQFLSCANWQWGHNAKVEKKPKALIALQQTPVPTSIDHKYHIVLLSDNLKSNRLYTTLLNRNTIFHVCLSNVGYVHLTIRPSLRLQNTFEFEFQHYKPTDGKRYGQRKRTKISQLIISETVIKVGREVVVWLWMDCN